jgi:solute carrier family 50 protein (sugar transporter)
VASLALKLTFLLLDRPTVATIRRSRSTLQFSFAPFFFYFVQSVIYTLYGWTTGNPVVGGTSLLGAVLGSYYVLVFYKFARDRTQATRMLTSAMLVILLLAHQVLTREPEETQMLTGIPANILSVFTAASPLLQLKSILRRKDASCLPLGMSTMNVVAGTIWTVYGIMLGDPLVICPNLFALTMGSIQVSLILLYPGGKGSAAEPKAKMSPPTKPAKKTTSPHNKKKAEHPE